MADVALWQIFIFSVCVVAIIYIFRWCLNYADKEQKRPRQKRRTYQQGRTYKPRSEAYYINHTDDISPTYAYDIDNDFQFNDTEDPCYTGNKDYDTGGDYCGEDGGDNGVCDSGGGDSGGGDSGVCDSGGGDSGGCDSRGGDTGGCDSGGGGSDD